MASSSTDGGVNGQTGKTGPSLNGGTATVPQAELNRYLVANAIMSRLKAFQRGRGDERRDLYEECHWRREWDARGLYWTYRRNPVAGRVVEVLPKECWQVIPWVGETEDMEVTTPFEKSFSELSNQLNGGLSFYRGPENANFWEYMRRLDVMSGVGRYGVLLLGIDDGRDLSKPADLRQRSSPDRKLLYMRVYPESMAQITAYETSKFSPRYGHPLSYNVACYDSEFNNTEGAAPPSDTVNVHWSRVIHLADNIESSEVLGTPRCVPVLNNLDNIEKIYGAGPEGYWLASFPTISLETLPELGGDVYMDEAKLRVMMEDWSQGLQRWFALQNMTAKGIKPDVVDPNPHLMAQLQMIALKLGTPLRILMGSERGEAAASQDDAAWNDRIRERENNHLTPREIVPTVDRLILMGVLPVPKEGYRVVWPDLESQGAIEKANSAMKLSQALAQYVSSGSALMMPFKHFLTKIMKFTDAEADSMDEEAAAMSPEEKKRAEEARAPKPADPVQRPTGDVGVGKDQNQLKP